MVQVTSNIVVNDRRTRKQKSKNDAHANDTHNDR